MTAKKAVVLITLILLGFLSIFNYATAPAEDFAQHGTVVVAVGAVAGALGELLALLVLASPIFLIAWAINRRKGKQDQAAPNDQK